MDVFRRDLQRLIEELSKSCSAGNDPFTLVLIGSLSRGCFRRNSDVDLCLVSHDPAQTLALLPEKLKESAEVYTNQNDFFSLTISSFEGVANEITIKVFHIDRIQHLFLIDQAVMCYIYQHAVYYVDHLDVRALYLKAFENFEGNLPLYTRRELSKARNVLYMMEETEVVYNDPVSLASCKMEFFERLIRVWFLSTGKPYPYKKWMFSEARAQKELLFAFKPLWDCNGRVEAIDLSDVKDCYRNLIKLLGGTLISPAEAGLELGQKEYYGYLDW